MSAIRAAVIGTLFVAFNLLLVESGKDLPKELQDPTLFCEGCYGTIVEITQMMHKSRGRKDLKLRVNEAFGKVCQNDNLKKYVFSPPKMVKVFEIKWKCVFVINMFASGLRCHFEDFSNGA